MDDDDKKQLQPAKALISIVKSAIICAVVRDCFCRTSQLHKITYYYSAKLSKSAVLSTSEHCQVLLGIAEYHCYVLLSSTSEHC